MRKEKYEKNDKSKEAGIKTIKKLLDLGFNEDEIEEILCTSVRNEACQKRAAKANIQVNLKQ